MSPARRLTLLGQLSLSITSDESRGTAQPWRLAFLAYIAQSRAVGVPRDRLADLFWPDAARERARHSLSNALYALRKELGENIIHTDRGRVWVELGVLEVDAVEFEDAIAGGAWDKAVELYRGPLMEGFSAKGSPELQRWLTGRRAELGRLYGRALEHVAATATEAGDVDGAVGWWRKLAAHEPHNSTFAAGLMRSLDLAGAPEAAIEHAREHQEGLRRAFGIEDDPLVRTLVDEIRSGSSPAGQLRAAQPTPEPSGGVPPTPQRGEGDLPFERPNRRIVRDLIAWGLGAAAAIALLVVFVLRPVVRAPLHVVLSDFAEDVGDPGLAIALTEALRVDLSRAEHLDLLGPDLVRSGLQLMRRDADGSLPRDLARELAVRDGFDAVIEGEIRRVGVGYLLLARLTAPESGAVIGNNAYRESAQDSTGLIDAMNRLALSIRRGTGERGDELAASEPLARVTTASLEALRLYSEAERIQHGNGAINEEVELLQRAVELDSTFASAHLRLGIIQRQLRQHDLSRQTFMKAFAYRARLPPSELQRLEAEHALVVLGDFERGIERYESSLADRPDEVGTLVALADTHTWRRQWDAAAIHLDRAILVDSLSFSAWAGLVRSRWHLGSADAAIRTFAQMREQFPEDPRLLFVERQLAEAEGRFGDAEEMALRDEQRIETGIARQHALQRLGSLVLARGRVRDARRYLDEAESIAWSQGRRGAAVLLVAVGAHGLFQVTGDRQRSRRWLDEGLGAFPHDSVPLLDRPYLSLAVTNAWLGRAETAQAMMNEYRRLLDPLYLQFEREPLERYAQGVVDHMEGRYDSAAVNLSRATELMSCARCALPALAAVEEQRGDPFSADDIRRRFLDTPQWSTGAEIMPSRGGEIFWRGPVLEALARASYRNGLAEDGVRYDRLLIEFWSDADEELQPRVQAARDRLEAVAGGPTRPTRP